MNPKLRLAAQSWAFAALFLLSDYQSLLAPTGERRMVSPVPLATLAFGELADILFVALLYAGFVWLLRRFTPWRYTQWIVVATTAVLLGIGLRSYITFVPRTTLHLRRILWPLAAVILVIAYKKFPHLALRAKTAAGTIFAGFVIFAVLLSGELLRLSFWRPATHGFSHAATVPENSNRQRLVWIIFDELDYYQTYGHRDTSLQLPNFDRLRDQSTLYSDVPPVRQKTLEAIPSFLIGSKVEALRFNWSNQVQIKTSDNDAWHTLSPENTVFETAHRSGLRSAIVGWVFPYCSTFGAVIDQCYGTDHDASWDGAHLSGEDSFWHDFWAPLRSAVISFYDGHIAQRLYLREMSADHLRTTNDLTTHALDTLRNSQADVIYLHLSVPHPPAMRDRHTRQFTSPGTYLDSLDQADEVLGKLLDVMQAQPRWQHTTVIVQGDHGWRNWGGYIGFNAENRKVWLASPQDYKPLVLVHQSGQATPATVSEETNPLKIHEIAMTAVQQIKP